MGYATGKIRNVAFIGHGGNGKTSLAESLLYVTGITDRLGKVEDGNTVSDYDPEEQKRHISISTSLIPIEYEGYKLNFLDCPGYFDFEGEQLAALTAADGAVIVVNAMAGVDVGCEKAVALCQRLKMPHLIVVNQLDRENASFDKAVKALTDAFGSVVTPIGLPILENGKLVGVADLVAGTERRYPNKQTTPIKITEAVTAAKAALGEAAASQDDQLMEKFFADEALTTEELQKGLALGVASGAIAPVLPASAVLCQGMFELLEAAIHFIPSPEGKIFTADSIKIPCQNDGPFIAQVFKTITDPFVGKLSLFRVLSGKLRSDTPLFNAQAGKTEKVGSVYIMRGKKQLPAEELLAGDIGALSKLAYTMTGHTLCTEAHQVELPFIELPHPSVTMAIYPKTQGEEDKVFSGLRRLEEEDPTFRISKNEETNEMVISGLGEMHLDIISRKLKNKFNTEIIITNPRIPYRETIRKTVKAEGKHKKQSGGHGQYGHCWIEFEPLTDGRTFEFVDKVVGGVVPRQYIPAVEKGLLDCIKKGVLAGFPMVGLRATLYDGSYHDVDSSEMAFKVAASLAYKKGCREANPVLLEPIYHITVHVPKDYMGDIIGDLNKRRGRILGMGSGEGKDQAVTAEAPLSELFRYATDLRSMTQARGFFEMEFARYEDVPPNVAAKVIEANKVETAEE